MGLQEIADALPGINLVGNAREAMAFILVDFQVHHAAALFDGIRHLP